jgi:uncharacterized protein (DUF433 family)
MRPSRTRCGLCRVEQMLVSDPEIVGGFAVYKGTRIPVDQVRAMTAQGASVEEILEGYPALNREQVELTPLYVAAFPRRVADLCPSSMGKAETHPGRALPERGRQGVAKLLIDECVHASLLELAHAAAHLADHVNYLGLGSSKDWELMAVVLEQDYTFPHQQPRGLSYSLST